MAAISSLPNGIQLQPTDIIPISRNGRGYFISGASLLAMIAVGGGENTTPANTFANSTLVRANDADFMAPLMSMQQQIAALEG